MKSKLTIKELFLFLFGGVLYYLIEIIYDGTSHWSMALIGGIAFIIMGGLNECFTWEMPLWKQCIISTVVIMVLEFITGCIVNLWLGLNIWNYEYLDILGQISLPFAFVWYILSAVGIFLDDLIRWKLFKEEKPRYRLR